MGQQAYSRSKQNSDAAGMMYNWGRKDPFTFATSSLHNEGLSGYGKYPVKIYNDKSELIYQLDGGGDNIGKTPVGGLIYQTTVASSMMETVKKPNIFFLGSNKELISQTGHSKELWNFYWTSYSRGVDRAQTKPYWHNTYLDGYIVLRTKSIYDPCPYGYRIPTNGTYNEFIRQHGWNRYSYDGGSCINNSSWFAGGGNKSALYVAVAEGAWILTSMLQSDRLMYQVLIYSDLSRGITFGDSNCNIQSRGFSVRCIEDATVKADDTH